MGGCAGIGGNALANSAYRDTLGWERSATNWAQLLFATSSVTLIFPTLDLVAIPTFLAAWSMAAYFRMLQYFANSVNEHSLRASLELMLALTLFTLFSFNVLVVLAWMVLGVWVFLFRLRKGFNVSFVVNILEWLLIGIIILTGVAVVYGALYWWTGFDILTCFQQAVQNNATQMNYSAADNIASPARYLFRSTGNILAYSIAAGAWVVFLALFGSRRSERRGAGLLTGVLYGTTFAVLVAAGFSTLFLGETERVWGFFTPCLAALAGFGMRAWMRRYGWRTAFVTFALLFLASIAFEAYLSHVC